MLKNINRFDLTWALLSVITIVSWQLGAQHGEEVLHLDPAITAAVIAFSLVKVRFIIREFMEVRVAPLSIKILSDIWIVAVFISLMTFYFMAA